MTELRSGRCGKIPVLSLSGEVGSEQVENVKRAISEAFRSTDRRVLLDLRSTLHLHYRVAGSLAEAARASGRLGLVGPSAYVRQILCLAGVLEWEVPEYRDLEEALRDVAA